MNRGRAPRPSANPALRSGQAVRCKSSPHHLSNPSLRAFHCHPSRSNGFIYNINVLTQIKTHACVPSEPQKIFNFRATPKCRETNPSHIVRLTHKGTRLRNDSTRCEIQFWLAVKNRQILGYQFHRQVPMLELIVDFYCHELMLAIEIDGVSHESDEAEQYDAYRQ